MDELTALNFYKTTMKKNFKFLVLIAMIATTAMAQVQFDKVKIPADTRLYLQLLENGDKQVRARSMEAKATQPEAQLFVSCDADADTKAIEDQVRAFGAKPQGTIGRYIMVSTPVSVVNKIADIEGVTYISKGPSVAADSWPLLRSWEAASVCPSAVPPVCMPYR